ncbi:MAG: hypothetical protein M5U12_06760 [Verrucomicrobia bacterium]|nr:hypothetical protein [Verrucomicrobiota bacterium]
MLSAIPSMAEPTTDVKLRAICWARVPDPPRHVISRYHQLVPNRGWITLTALLGDVGPETGLIPLGLPDLLDE